MIKTALADAALKRYNVPEWMREYIHQYLKGKSIGDIKHAITFIQVGRKKGVIAPEGIKLPNGTTFKKEQMAHLLELLYYGEDRVGKISKEWSMDPREKDHIRSSHFANMAALEAKRARAIKNLIEGLGLKVKEPPKQFKEVYDYVETIDNWHERLITKKILLNYAYGKPFGLVFYRVFYCVSPEFMRTLGKTYNTQESDEIFGEQEADRMVQERLVNHDSLMNITRNLLTLTTRAINTEIPVAKKAGIVDEVTLLRDISVAYPLHRLNELGVEIDVKKEITQIKRSAQS